MIDLSSEMQSNARTVMRKGAKVEGAILQEYRTALAKIRSEISALYERLAGADGKVSLADAQRGNRLASIERQIARIIGDANTESAAMMESVLGQMYNEGYNRTAWAIDNGVQASLDWTRFSDRTIRAAINNPLRYLAEKQLFSDSVIRIRRELIQGLMQGRSYIDMARGMNNALGLTVRRWQRIFRTEGHRAQAESTVQGLDDAEEQGLEVRRRLQSVLDDRTRPQSAQMDGQIADAEGYFHYPPTAEDGDPKSRYPGNTGVAAYDVNDREVVVVDIPGVTDVFRRIRGEGVQPYQTFRTWATDRGLTENIYGQEYKL